MENYTFYILVSFFPNFKTTFFSKQYSCFKWKKIFFFVWNDCQNYVTISSLAWNLIWSCRQRWVMNASSGSSSSIMAKFSCQTFLLVMFQLTFLEMKIIANFMPSERFFFPSTMSLSSVHNFFSSATAAAYQILIDWCVENQTIREMKSNWCDDWIRSSYIQGAEKPPKKDKNNNL